MSAARLLFLWLAIVLAGCGGGGSDTPATSPTPTVPVQPVVTVPNIAPITVNLGPDGRSINSPFVSVTVCVPGTQTCQTLDHVLVDTGSYGLRLAASAVSSTLALPTVQNTAGVAVAECAHFATGYAWGSVRRADVKLAGETASNLPIQIVGDPAAPYAPVPSACTSTGANFGASMAINGILGVGFFVQDCPACATSAAPATYFACAATGCVSTVLARASQVANPVSSFAVNNNGVVLVLPQVPVGGTTSLAGSLVFGIGTQANNQLVSQTVYTADSRGNFTTRYKGTSYAQSFIDSGSNGIFFTDPAIPQCSGFYCPPAPLDLTAENVSATGVTGTVGFTVESVRALDRSVVAAHIGGTMDDSTVFDWGLPFFFGRNVFVAFIGAATPKGTGPYWAY